MMEKLDDVVQRGTSLLKWGSSRKPGRHRQAEARERARDRVVGRGRTNPNSEAAVIETTTGLNRTVGKRSTNNRSSCLSRIIVGTSCSVRKSRKTRRKNSIKRHPRQTTRRAGITMSNNITRTFHCHQKSVGRIRSWGSALRKRGNCLVVEVTTWPRTNA